LDEGVGRRRLPLLHVVHLLLQVLVLPFELRDRRLHLSELHLVGLHERYHLKFDDL